MLKFKFSGFRKIRFFLNEILRMSKFNFFGFRKIRLFLNETLQMSKFKFFVSQDKFSRTAQIFLKFANVKCN